MSKQSVFQDKDKYGIVLLVDNLGNAVAGKHRMPKQGQSALHKAFLALYLAVLSIIFQNTGLQRRQGMANDNTHLQTLQVSLLLVYSASGLC